MAEEKKKPESEEEKKPEVSEAEKSDEKKDESPKTDEKPADENPEKTEEKPPEGQTESKAEESASTSEKSDAPDAKDEEILRLKTQIAAMQLGIKSDCVEDAVAIAESYIKAGKSADINAALSEVVKKYPDMKSDSKDNKKQGGFKVGADTPKDEKNAADESLDKAFGLRKKK